MSLSYDRRRRRRRRLLIGVVVVGVLLAVAYGVTRIQSSDALRREYLDTALSVAKGEEGLAERFSALIIELQDTDRTLMVETLEYLEESVNLLVGELASVTPPSGLQRAAVYLDVATASWRDGIEQIKAAILVFAESEGDPVDTLALDLGLMDLRIGDATYGRFIEALAADEIDLGERVFPNVTYNPDDQAGLFDADDVLRRLLLSELLGAVRDLAVSDLNLDPGPTGEEAGIPVVPYSEQLDAAVTIANRGNVFVEQASVVLQVVSNEGDFAEFEQTVGELQPGQLTALLFENLPVTPGKIYEVIVTLPDGDDDRTNDRLSIVFVRNPNS
jgi:hypothetical protein